MKGKNVALPYLANKNMYFNVMTIESIEFSALAKKSHVVYINNKELKLFL